MFLVTLQVLYKLKTAKVFEKSRNKDDRPNTDIVDEDPYAIQQEVTTEVIPVIYIKIFF